jgi:hypothetical protein
MIRARSTTLTVAAFVLAALVGCQSEKAPPAVDDGFNKAGGHHSENQHKKQVRARPAVRLAQAGMATLRVRPDRVLASSTTQDDEEAVHQTIDARRGQQKHTSLVLVTRKGAKSEVRTVGQSSYLKSEEATVAAAMPPGKEWVRMPTSQLAVAGMPSVDGLLSVLYVVKGATGVREVSKNPARYSFAIKLDKAICAAPSRLRPKIQSLLTPNADGSVSMKGMAWLTASKRLQRLHINAASAGQRVAAYDLRVAKAAASTDVAQPAAEQVVALEEIAGEKSPTSGPTGDASC